jgi:hypothetical protein
MAQSIRLKVVEFTTDLMRTKTVLIRPDGYTGDTRFFHNGLGVAPDLLCGECGSVLVEGVAIADMVLQCGQCRAFNEYVTGDLDSP